MILITGLATFIGLWGTGAALLRVGGLEIPSPWSEVTAILLGVQVLSLAVQIVGMAGIASRLALISLWLALAVIGIAMLLLRGRTALTVSLSTLDRWTLLPLAVIGVAVATNLLIALAPSTKIDELYYHMLVPSRIVSDGALRFYRLPWVGAIWPQMSYQISAAPVHALGYPDAPNVVSWGLGATLVWFAWRIIRDTAKSEIWSALWAASLCVGLYPAVWTVTAGAHAMGDMAMAAAIVAFCAREHFLTTASRPAYAAMFSVLLLSASTSKITLLPLAGVLFCLGAWPLFRPLHPKAAGQIGVALATPWIVFYCPISIWTWAQSGSPYGPVLANAFSHSVYPAEWFQETLRSTRQEALPLMSVIRYISINYSPLVWLGVIGSIFGTNLPKPKRGVLAGLFVLQSVVIYWAARHYEARYLGGLHYGLVIVFACYVRPDIQRCFSSARAVAVSCVMFLVPWLCIQIYYARQFIPVSLGLEKTAFYERYIAFYADYVQLDRMIPKDAVILVQGFRLGAVYAPRPVFFDPADLPLGKEAVLFASPGTVDAAVPPVGYKLGDVIYEDAEAVVETFRTPGLPSISGPLKVVRLIPE
jgi:hypothetical protein